MIDQKNTDLYNRFKELYKSDWYEHGAKIFKRYTDVHISDLLGEVVVGYYVTKISDEDKGESLILETDDGFIYEFFHEQDCCEEVYLDDINGDLDDLVGNPILITEERTNRLDPPKDDNEESYLWTFYLLATIKGSVLMRWYGSSNGYYSESITIRERCPI